MRLGSEFDRSRILYWVLGKETDISCYNNETMLYMLFTLDPDYRNLF